MVVLGEGRRIQQQIGSSSVRDRRLLHFGEIRQTVGDLPVHVDEENLPLIVEFSRETADHLGRTRIAASVQHWKITVRSRSRIRDRQRSHGQHRSRRQAPREGDSWRDQQRQDEMRWQIEHMGVADVVAKCESDVRREQHGHEASTRHILCDELYKARESQQRRDRAELLPEVEPVHRGVVAKHRAWYVHHHRVAPVGFGHVEPESLERVEHPLRWLRLVPQRAQIPDVLSGPDDCACDRKQHNARRDHRSPTIFRTKKEKHRVGWREKDHRQVVAKSDRIDGKKQREACRRRIFRPP